MSLGAVKQGDPDLLFQLAYLSAQGWLGHVKPGRGTTEVKLLGGRHEVPKKAKLHCYPQGIREITIGYFTS
jgi:hypothetical protein